MKRKLFFGAILFGGILFLSQFGIVTFEQANIEINTNEPTKLDPKFDVTNVIKWIKKVLF